MIRTPVISDGIYLGETFLLRRAIFLNANDQATPHEFRSFFLRPLPPRLASLSLRQRLRRVCHRLRITGLAEIGPELAWQMGRPVKYSGGELNGFEERARYIRRETIRLISIAKVGHYASAFSCAEILSTLFYGVMNLKAGEPDWPDRDRFMFGKGHAAVALYPVLAAYDFIPR